MLDLADPDDVLEQMPVFLLLDIVDELDANGAGVDWVGRMQKQTKS